MIGQMCLITSHAADDAIRLGRISKFRRGRFKFLSFRYRNSHKRAEAIEVGPCTTRKFHAARHDSKLIFAIEKNRHFQHTTPSFNFAAHWSF